jgi:hypothetical protein
MKKNTSLASLLLNLQEAQVQTPQASPKATINQL